ELRLFGEHRALPCNLGARDVASGGYALLEHSCDLRCSHLLAMEHEGAALREVLLESGEERFVVVVLVRSAGLAHGAFRIADRGPGSRSNDHATMDAVTLWQGQILV